jgi:hypothetical protein
MGAGDKRLKQVFWVGHNRRDHKPLIAIQLLESIKVLFKTASALYGTPFLRK